MHRADPWLPGYVALFGGSQKFIPEIEIKLPLNTNAADLTFVTSRLNAGGSVDARQMKSQDRSNTFFAPASIVVFTGILETDPQVLHRFGPASDQLDLVDPRTRGAVVDHGEVPA